MPLRKRQKGVFAIEFALGFIVLFMFTMLIFETCRLTYICSVLDYATAEAARDARVQLQKNEKFKDYQSANCAQDYKDQPEKMRECFRIQNMYGNELAIWYYAFIKENSTALMRIFSIKNDIELDVKPYLNPDDYSKDIIYTGPNVWSKATLAEYEVTYTYRPLMFRWNVFEYLITRRLLIVQDTALFRGQLKGER